MKIWGRNKVLLDTYPVDGIVIILSEEELKNLNDSLQGTALEYYVSGKFQDFADEFDKAINEILG